MEAENRAAGALAFSFVFIVLAAGCAHNDIYRSQYPDQGPWCVSDDPENDCPKAALQAYDDGPGTADYRLGFIEFDDQGQLHDREQMHRVLDSVGRLANDGELLMVVFVHGWKHNAKPGDEDIKRFRRALQDISERESLLSYETERERKVVGVYLGWRGESITAPLLKQLSFWDRKKTAHQVGRGDMAEVLARIERIQRIQKARRRGDDEASPEQDQSPTRLVVIGHSFGGAAVYSALSHLLVSRLMIGTGVEPAGAGTGGRTPVDPALVAGNADGFGDLVVLMNPAFEADRYSSLGDIANERRSYFHTQRPVLAVLTSETDNATRLAFPLGRFFSTFFDRHREVTRLDPVDDGTETIDQSKADVTALGHFEPYRTHRLAQAADADPGEAAGTTDRAVELAARSAASRVKGTAAYSLAATRARSRFLDFAEQWRNDRPGSRIAVGDMVLTRTEDTVGRNPYMIIRVDEAVMRDHGDIYNPLVSEFLVNLVGLSTRSPEQVDRLMKAVPGR